MRDQVSELFRSKIFRIICSKIFLEYSVLRFFGILAFRVSFVSEKMQVNLYFGTAECYDKGHQVMQVAGTCQNLFVLVVDRRRV